MASGGGSTARNDATYQANIMRDDEEKRQNKVNDATFNINDKFDKMFTPDFFSGRQQGLIDYQKPQLDDQFATAQKNLTYWLDNKGLLDSSTRNDKQAELQKLYDTNNTQINNSALDLANKEKQDVATARSSLIDDARNSADPDASNSATIAQMGALSTPEIYSPLADMFSGFTSALSQQAAYERAASLSGGAIRPTFNTGLFAPSANAVQVSG